MEQLTIKTERPKWDDQMTMELAVQVGEIVNQWCEDSESLEECVEAASKILKYHSSDDGYQLAKAFEDYGFDADPNLVNTLDDVFFKKQSILKKHIKQWVVQNNLVLEFGLGEIVRVKKNSIPSDTECDVVKLYPETMQYGIWYEGHSSEKGTGHRIINSEDVSRF